MIDETYRRALAKKLGAPEHIEFARFFMCGANLPPEGVTFVDSKLVVNTAAKADVSEARELERFIDKEFRCAPGYFHGTDYTVYWAPRWSVVLRIMTWGGHQRVDHQAVSIHESYDKALDLSGVLADPNIPAPHDRRLFGLARALADYEAPQGRLNECSIRLVLLYPEKPEPVKKVCELFGYPVYESADLPSIAEGPVSFGNWKPEVFFVSKSRLDEAEREIANLKSVLEETCRVHRAKVRELEERLRESKDIRRGILEQVSQMGELLYQSGISTRRARRTLNDCITALQKEASA